jgi:hypothetical protein
LFRVFFTENPQIASKNAIVAERLGKLNARASRRRRIAAYCTVYDFSSPVRFVAAGGGGGVLKVVAAC